MEIMESATSLHFNSVLTHFRSNSHKPIATSFSFPLISFRSSSRTQRVHVSLPKKQRMLTFIRASSNGETVNSDFQVKWVLQPVGDGDCRHIGYKVALPAAFEIASNVVTVGRLPDKADMVIPIATVSGVHARFEKKGEDLFVADMGSTNSTFIDEKRLTPGVFSYVPPGCLITFGDSNLAIFRVSKVEVPAGQSLIIEEQKEEEESNVKPVPTENVEIVS